MARFRSGADDQKQILTITLVLFVLLSIILGVVAYFGYAEQGELRAQIATLKRQFKKAGEDRDAAIVAMVTCKEAIGANIATRDEQGQLEGMRNVIKAKGPDGKEVLAWELTIRPLKDIIWDNNQKLPTKTYMDTIRDLRGALTKAAKAEKDMKDQKDQNDAKYAQNVAALNKANDEMKKALDATNEVIGKKFDDVNKRYNEQIEQLVKSMPNFEVQEKKIKELEAERDKVVGQLRVAVAEARAQREKLEAKIPQLDLLAYEQPKGKITNLDREGKTAYLNLGTADAVRPGLTFSVWTPGQYKADLPQKGRVEIVQVLDKHLSIAKVMEVRNAARDPLMRGDDLRNPVWTPGLREHVAIAGFIDLVGDGRDATPELVRLLEKQGVIVDVWFDLRDMTLKGANKDKEEKITRQTTYFIRGATPDLEVAMPKEDDKRQQGKLSIKGMVDDLEIKAKERSVTIVDARRFLALMGMKAPVRTKDTDWAHYLFRKPKDGAADEGPAKKDDAKEAPKKKEEEKEK